MSMPCKNSTLLDASKLARFWPLAMVGGLLLVACQRDPEVQVQTMSQGAGSGANSGDALGSKASDRDDARLGKTLDSNVVVVTDDPSSKTDDSNLPTDDDSSNNNVTPNTSDSESSASAAVVAYANSQMGTRVGNGQCTELAAYALRSAGISGYFPNVRGDGAYVWGTHVVQLSSSSGSSDVDKIKPGYILQLEGVSAGGMQAQHHTQVVIENRGNGVIAVAEQNPSAVAVNQWNYGKLQSGTVDVWAPSR